MEALSRGLWMDALCKGGMKKDIITKLSKRISSQS